MFSFLYSLLLSIYQLLTAPFRKHPCSHSQCACANYTDEAFFTWMKARTFYHTYADEMLDARIIGRPLNCSFCEHPRQSHGTLKKKLLTCDAMPDGGAVYNQQQARLRIQRREKRFKSSSQLPQLPQVQIQDIVLGDGLAISTGSVVLCHYDAFLHTTMHMFETSRANQHPFQFTMGEGSVIRGWEKGLAGVKVGGKRRLTIPPELAFASRSINGQTNATVVFDIEIIAVLSS